MSEIGEHFLEAVQMATPPARHAHDPVIRPTERFSLEKLFDQCEAYGVDIHEVLARALMPENEEKVPLRAQANLAWNVIDKAVPSKRAIESHVDHTTGGRPIVWSKDDERL